MKKCIVSLLFALITTLSLSLTAQPLTSDAPNWDFTPQDISYWIGEGENEIGIIIAYENGMTPNYFVLGYRWDEVNTTLADALEQITDEDARFYFDYRNGFLEDFAFDYDEDGTYEYTGASVSGYFAFLIDCQMSSVGIGGYRLVGNKWIQLECQSMSHWGTCLSEYEYDYTPVPAPNTEPVTCPAPENFRVDWIEENTATAFWQGGNIYYRLYYKEASAQSWEYVDVSGALYYQFNGILQAGTEYECYVESYCPNDNEYSQPTDIVTFTTLAEASGCAEISELPYEEDFDSYGVSSSPNFVFPDCWTKVSQTNTPNISSTKHSGTGGLYMQAAAGNKQAAVLPKVSSSINMDNIAMTFWAKVNTLGHRIVVGVMTYEDDLFTFDTVSVVVPENKLWNEYTVYFYGHNANGHYIAFLSQGGESSGNVYYIDDVSVFQVEQDEQAVTINIDDENIISWAKGLEIYNRESSATGNYYDAIGVANTADYVALTQGYAVATFDRPVSNGTSGDFAVFANNPVVGSAYIEVSSDGENYFRFDTPVANVQLGEGVVYDLEDLENNTLLDKDNIRFVRVVDNGGFNLSGIAVLNGGTVYKIADFEDGDFLTSSNSYEIVSQTNYTRMVEDEDRTYYYNDHISNGLNFPGAGYNMEYDGWSWFMAMGFGASNATTHNPVGNGGSYVSPTYYVSASHSALEGEGSTYLQAYYDAYSMGVLPHNEVSINEYSTFYPQGVYLSHSQASYSYSGTTNDNQAGYEKIVAKGYGLNGELVNTAEIYLTENGTAYKDWKYMDLSSLGEVQKVAFSIESNYANSAGLLVPSYFCLDNFVYTEGTTVQTEERTVCFGETYMGHSESGTYQTEDGVLILTVLPQNTETLDVSVCNGQTYEFNGQTYETSGTYTTTVEGGENECPTVYTVNLTVKDAVTNEVTVTLSQSELPYTFAEQTFDNFGTYTVVLTSYEQCDSTVTLTLVHDSGINDNKNNSDVSLYPNPTKNSALLTINGLTSDAAIIISDVQGRVVRNIKMSSTDNTINIDTDNLTSGVYYVRIISEGMIRTEKLIKE